jgi:hypothetical protein
MSDNIQLIECIVCREHKEAHIYSCRCLFSRVCSDCYLQCSKCPTCRVPCDGVEPERPLTYASPWPLLMSPYEQTYTELTQHEQTNMALPQRTASHTFVSLSFVVERMESNTARYDYQFLRARMERRAALSIPRRIYLRTYRNPAATSSREQLGAYVDMPCDNMNRMRKMYFDFAALYVSTLSPEQVVLRKQQLENIVSFAKFYFPNEGQQQTTQLLGRIDRKADAPNLDDNIKLTVKQPRKKYPPTKIYNKQNKRALRNPRKNFQRMH